MVCQILFFTQKYSKVGLKMAKKSSTNSFARSFVLLAVFIVLLLLMGRIGDITHYFETAFAESSFDARIAASDSLRQEYYDSIAGFWEHHSENLSDRIEILDNGIIWRFTETRFDFPHNRRREISRVSHAYLMPTAFGDNNFAASNLRIIREAWFMPDTCFGNSFYDIVAHTSFRNDTLFFDGVPYTRFQGELTDFFPAGALNLLNLNIEALTMPSCRSRNIMLDWLRENISFSFHNREIPLQMLRFEQERLLRDFYVPYVLSRTESSMLFGNTYNIDLTVVISPDGRVEDVSVRGSDFVSQARRQPIINEVRRWRFPADGENSATVRFVGSFVRKQ